jgi:hypothetical protein
MIWIALAAQLSAPQPLNPSRWWSSAEMPTSVKYDGVTRKVLTRTTLKPDGSIMRCDVEGPSGDPKADLLTCAIIVKRGKFQPARDVDGNPVYGVYRETVIWAVVGPADAADDAPIADLQLTVSKLPKGVKSPATVRLMFVVDQSGQISNCVAEPTPDIPSANRQLAGLACQQLIKSYTATPAKDAQSTGVLSVQDAAVVFAVQK